MNIEKLCNYDLLLSFETESRKLLLIFKDNLYNNDTKLNTCKQIAIIGVEILDRYFKTFNSISSSVETDFFNDNNFIEALGGRVTNVLKVSRFCLEYIIWYYDYILIDSDKEAEIITLLELLCKILFHQGDFLECSIILERILGDCIVDTLGEKTKVKYKYLFDFFSSWNLLDIRKTISPIYVCNNNIFGGFLLKELKMQNLCSTIMNENNFDNMGLTNYTEIIKEIQHSIIKVYSETRINSEIFSTIRREEGQEKFALLFESMLMRLERCKTYKNDIDNKYKCYTEMTDHFLGKSDIKQVEHPLLIKSRDNTDIFTCLEQFVPLNGTNNSNASFNPYKTLRDYLEGLSEKLNVKSFRSESKVATDRRTRSKNNSNNEFSNCSLNKVEYNLGLDIESPLKHIMVDILNNITLPKYNDKQCRIWIQTIPYYCYNLILSVQKKQEIKCDDIFSLNLNSNFPTIEQFDEMIINETNKITEHYTKMTDTKINYQDIITLLNKLENEYCIDLDENSIYKDTENKITFIYAKVQPSIDHFLLSANIMLNKILKYIFLSPNKDSQVLVEEINTIFFSLVERLFNNYTELIRRTGIYTDLSQNKNNHSSVRINYSCDSNFHDEKCKFVIAINKLYYLLFKMTYPMKKNIIILLNNIMKNLIVFIFFTNNIISYNKNEKIMAFYNQLKSDFFFLVDLFTIIKEKFNIILPNIDFSTRRLLILFKVLEIPLAKIYLESEFVFILKDDIMKVGNYNDQIDLILDLYTDFGDNINDIEDNFSIGYGSILFSYNNIQIIKDKLVNWKNVFNSKSKHEFSSNSVNSYSMFLNNNYLEYLHLKKIDSDMRTEIINQNFLQHIYNLTMELDMHLTKSFDVFDSGLLRGLLIPLLKSLILIMNEDVNYLDCNSIIVNRIIYTLTRLLLNIIELYESGKMIFNEIITDEAFHNLISETIIINITCIHKHIMGLISKNKLNIITKNLMNLLISLFDFKKYLSSIEEISSNSIIILIRYLTYLEFSFELVNDENKDIKDIRTSSKISDNEVLKRHILSNYCTLTPIIENLAKDIDIHNLSCTEVSHKKLDIFFDSILNTKMLLLSTTIKFGLFSNFPSVESWFEEIENFVEKYEINDHFKHWNLLYLECKRVVRKYSILNKSLNMRNLYVKNKLGEYVLSPEQETEYLEILGIILQLLYGIPVCPLPSVPFNKMPIYDQDLIYDYLFDLSNTASNPTCLKDLFYNWLSNRIIDNLNSQTNDILEYISPYSPLIMLSCNIFKALINCTSLTEKQYSDSRVKFYTSIIGLIERLFFKGKCFVNLELDSIWNIIGSPLFYPSFMNNLNNVFNNEKINYSNIFIQNTLLESNISSILYNSQVSDEILNFYDNIMVISPSLYYSELNKFESINKHTGDELLFDNISIYNEGNKLAMVSLEPFLYCKYYYAYILDKLMKSKMNLKFLYENLDENLIQIRRNATDFISFSDIFLQINWKNNIKRYIPFKFLNDCFVSCIPVSYMDRSSSLWNPSKFGVIGNSTQPSLCTLFKYLKWLNMNLFLIGEYDLKIITCCNSILKQMICELDDYDAFENIENEYPIILKRMIAQIIYLQECEIKYFKKLESGIQISYLHVINSILSITFDQIIMRFINIKGFYGKTNTKYLLMYLNYQNSQSKYISQNRIFSKNYDCSLLVNSIEVISGFRRTLFTEFIPALFIEDEKWYSIHSNSLSQIHNCVWLPSFIESKMRFKLAKILISSYLQINMSKQNDFKEAIMELKNAYCLSVESLIICFLILSGNTDDIYSFFRIQKRTSDNKELMNYFHSKILAIYTTIFNIYLNKFPEKNPLSGKVEHVKNQMNVSNIQISYSNLSSNLASVLFYFYKSFINLQSIKQFIIILIASHHIPLNSNEIAEFKNLVKMNNNSLDTSYGVEEMINELIYDELNSNQTTLKKNRLTQSLFTTAINQSFSHFSIINFIISQEDPKNLLCYYQKFFLFNKKIMNFTGFEHNKMITDHYSGLYLRRSRKHLLYKYKCMLTSSMIIMIIRNEIISNVNRLLLTCIHSDVEIHAYYNKDYSLENYNGYIFFPVYNLLLDKKCDGYTNIGKVSYYYLDNLNQMLDHLIDLLVNEFKTIRQLPAIENFEHLINDQIKNYNKKGVNRNLIDFGVIDWNDISESGCYNISLNIMEKTLNEIIDILNFVDNISLPIDGKLLSNLFGLVILFHKYEIICDNNSQTSEFIQCIPLNITKQLEKQLGSFILINIPFSVIYKIGKFKVSFENIFTNIFNKLFALSINCRKDLTQNYFFEVINLLIQFFGASSNGINISKTFTKSRGVEDVISDETQLVSKRMRCDISLFD